jgi:hypothetical protein
LLLGGLSPFEIMDYEGSRGCSGYWGGHTLLRSTSHAILLRYSNSSSSFLAYLASILIHVQMFTIFPNHFYTFFPWVGLLWHLMGVLRRWAVHRVVKDPSLGREIHHNKYCKYRIKSDPFCNRTDFFLFDSFSHHFLANLTIVYIKYHYLKRYWGSRTSDKLILFFLRSWDISALLFLLEQSIFFIVNYIVPKYIISYNE